MSFRWSTFIKMSYLCLGFSPLKLALQPVLNMEKWLAQAELHRFAIY